MKELPDCVREQDGLDFPKDWDWNILYRCSICSLVKGRDFEDDCCPRYVLLAWNTWTSPPNLVSLPFFFGFPCNFQQLSRVCHDFWQWSHRGFCFPPESVPRATRAYYSLSIFGSSLFFNITCRRASSLRISEKTSLIVGKGFFPSIYPWTSLSSLFKPSKKINTEPLSTFFLYRALSLGFSHYSSSNKSNSCQKAIISL